MGPIRSTPQSLTFKIHACWNMLRVITIVNTMDAPKSLRISSLHLLRLWREVSWNVLASCTMRRGRNNALE